MTIQGFPICYIVATPHRPTGKGMSSRVAMIRRCQRSSGILVAVAISSLLALVLFRDLLFPGRIHADFSLGGDTYRHLVIWASARNSIAEGFWPFWVPEIANGFPLWASFQWGLASPAFLLFVLLPVELAHTLSAALHLVLAGCGIYCLSQRLSVGRFGGLIALVGYSFSSFFVGRIAVGHIFLVWPMAWVPWALWALDRTLVRPTGARVAVAALLLCAALTAGHVHMAIYVYPLVAVWAIGRLWCERRAGNAKRAGSLRRTAAAFFGVVLLGTGLASIQWLPFLELLSASDGVPMTELDLRAASMPLEGLWSFLLPHVQGLRSESNFFGDTLYHETLCASSAAVIWLALLGAVAIPRTWGGVLVGLGSRRLAPRPRDLHAFVRIDSGGDSVSPELTNPGARPRVRTSRHFPARRPGPSVVGVANQTRTVRPSGRERRRRAPVPGARRGSPRACRWPPRTFQRRWWIRSSSAARWGLRYPSSALGLPPVVRIPKAGAAGGVGRWSPCWRSVRSWRRGAACRPFPPTPSTRLPLMPSRSRSHTDFGSSTARVFRMPRSSACKRPGFTPSRCSNRSRTGRSGGA